ncbi:MAG: beta-glucosidase BglX [Bacteroidales bacterium]|jgi:beta-glucosidase|nr:beta-glucosidase BglX [Bacteroidales bacterium]
MKKILILGTLLATCVACAPKSDMDRYIDGLMSRMTLEQKIGQLNLHSAPGFISADRVTEEDENTKMLRQGLLGGIYGSGNPQLLRQCQEIALESGAGIPLIFGLDVIHGHQTVFPIPVGLSTSWNMDLIEQTARVAATEATASGVNWVFSPMVDICRDARWGRIAEGAGEDPYLGGEIAKAMVYGYQGRDAEIGPDELLACVKHYALYGAAEAGRDYNSVFLSRQEALNGYLNPYKAAAEAGAASYMSSFNEFEGVPASMNRYLMQELLRDSWGFDGFIVSDATAVVEQVAHGIGDLQEVSARSLQAGLDMDMNSDGFIGTLQKSLDEGRVSEADIDRACRRILEAKYRLGLFEDPFRYFDEQRLATDVYTPENRAFARKVAQECLVLLKNDGVLPLRKDTRIAVVGPLADDASSMNGTWAMTSHAGETVTLRQGIAEAAPRTSYAEGSWLMLDKDQEESVRYGLMKVFMRNFQAPPVHARPQSALIAEAVAQARAADVVVACVGETANMNGEGASRSNPDIPDAQRELLKALKATGKPVVLVLVTGRPLVLTDEDASMNAILNVWSPGAEAGHAVADVLFGDVNPSAKLTLSFPRSIGQLPLYYNHKNTGRPHPDDEPYRKFTSCYIDELNGPLYPFGYGLSYTTYEYGEPRLSAAEMAQDGTVTASVTVRNTGSRDGDEIVQLYIHDVYASSTRPVKELRAFRKVHIPAGQSVTVDFPLTADDLAFYNHELEWVCEPGDFEIMTGPDSRDLQGVVLTVK